MSGRSVEVGLPGRAYQVSIGPGVLGTLATRARELLGDRASRAMLVIDDGVPSHFAESLVESLESCGFTTLTTRITPSESIKTIEQAHALLVEAARFGLTRVDPVIALGGGVTGDIAGFVAASYQRGIPVLQCPTTLLAMVDASVGGKTGVNLSVPDAQGGTELYKNMVGAFHQPSAVFADTATLDSLEDRYRRSGLSECVKHAMICRSVPGGEHDSSMHSGLLDWMEHQLEPICAFETGIIDELIERNVSLKRSVVLADERESPEARRGGRMLLNFGHTFAHAIETIPHLSPDPDRGDLAPLHHGEAVGLGMIAACHAGESMGMCDASPSASLIAMLGSIGLPISIEGLPGNEELLARMGHDKKAAGGSLRVILPSGRGECEIVADPDHEALRAGFDSIRG